MLEEKQPREMPSMTPAQRRANWWSYQWHYFLIGVAALAVLGGVLWERLSQIEPDCSVALVAKYAVTSSEAAVIEQAFEEVCQDTNGDGRVYVAINTIQIDYGSSNLDDAAVMAMSANIDKLHADFYTMQSGIFLLDDPENFQKNHQALAYLDGTVPPEGAQDWENMTIPWSACLPENIPLDNLDPDSLWLGSRAVTNPKEQKAFAGAQNLWETLLN